MASQIYCLVIFAVFVSIETASATDELYENDSSSVEQKRFLLDPDPTSHLDNHTIELLIFVDYQFYSSFYNKTTTGSHATRVQQAKTDIKEYVGLLMDSVNIVYQSLDQYGIRIRIEPVAIIILTTRAASPWTEQNVFMNGTTLVVDADKALGQIEAYVDSHKTLPPHDHAMTITGYNMTRNGDDILGIASEALMCKNRSGSLVQGDFFFRTAFTMAHELGHSLGSQHDGEGNDCDRDGGYTMDWQIKRWTVNSWIFTNCSAKYIKDDIAELNRHNQNCLLSKEYTSAIDTTLHKYSHMLYGMTYTVDEQCQLACGEDSFFIRERYNSSANYETLCLVFFCRYYDKENQTESSRVVDAGDGTSCGNRKWCMAGHCIDSPDAPALPANCPFGDTPGLIRFNLTCSELVQARPQECYKEDIGNICCKSCQSVPAFNIHQHHPNIPSPDQQCKHLYGTKSRFCQHVIDYHTSFEPICADLYCLDGDVCPSVLPQDGTTCGQGKFCVGLKCVDNPNADKNETCLFGDSAIDCQTIIPDETHKYLCYVNKKVCCGTCKQYINPNDTGNCTFGDKEKWCASLTDGHLCYLYSDTCCETCKKFYDPLHKDTCMYGDSASDCQSVIPDKAHSYNCYNNVRKCCKTCEAYKIPDDTGNCTYGDKGKWCATLTDGHLCYKYSNICCETCKKFYDPLHKDTCMYGDSVSDCQSVIPDKAHSYNCYYNTQKCCKTCEAYKLPHDTGNCTYGDKAKWCASTIPDRSQSYYCYTNDGDCCETCQAYYNPRHKGCEYGDRSDSCSRSRCHTYSADTRARLCCDTCRGV